MGINLIKTWTLFAVLLAMYLPSSGQIEGESEVTTVIIKKPGRSKDGKDDPAERMIRDQLPPVIRIIAPQLDTSFTARLSYKNTYLIGRLSDASGIHSLTINDQRIPADELGFFQHSLTLEDGLNVFKITATDARSNASTRYLHLIYQQPATSQHREDAPDQPGVYHGLIIGINAYKDPALVDLDHPIADATLIYSTLIGNYAFDRENVTLLKNPTRAEIIKQLDILSYRLTKNDNLLIFYAGHGYWDRERETGFWLPADADKTSSVNWIRNSTIQDFVDDIQTNHTLLITDACFAGSIFKSRGAFQDASVGVRKLYSLTSRKAMTSGTLEEVPDRSVFLEYLMKRLLENEKKHLSATELFNSFRDAVLNNSPNIPQYGVIQDTGDEGGDFIFIKR